MCRDYARRLRLIEAAGALDLIDARSDHPAVSALWRQGHDLDQGMVAQIGDMTYFGAEAVIVLAQLSSSGTLFNRLNHAVLSRPALAKALYPWLKMARRLALFVTGKKPLAEPFTTGGSPHR